MTGDGNTNQPNDANRDDLVLRSDEQTHKKTKKGFILSLLKNVAAPAILILSSGSIGHQLSGLVKGPIETIEHKQSSYKDSSSLTAEQKKAIDDKYHRLAEKWREEAVSQKDVVKAQTPELKKDIHGNIALASAPKSQADIFLTSTFALLGVVASYRLKKGRDTKEGEMLAKHDALLGQRYTLATSPLEDKTVAERLTKVDKKLSEVGKDYEKFNKNTNLYGKLGPWGAGLAFSTLVTAFNAHQPQGLVGGAPEAVCTTALTSTLLFPQAAPFTTVACTVSAGVDIVNAVKEPVHQKGQKSPKPQ